MSGFDCILPLGESCNITFLLQNLKLKKQTTLFEWFISKHLSHITNVLNKIGNNTDNDIIKQEGKYIYIGDNNIASEHYTLEEFKEIYIRRRNRLVDTIINSNKILFVRLEGNFYSYTKEDIDEFINSVKMINPKCDEIKLLLMGPNNNVVDHPCLMHVFFDKHGGDPWCSGKEMHDLFINGLDAIGYNINDRYDICFNDKSTL
jgi:hypothetical protein